MNIIEYDVTTGATLVIGHDREHNVNQVVFSGYTQKDSESTIYVDIKGQGLYPILDFTLNITYTITKLGTRQLWQLVELKGDDGSELVGKSDRFSVRLIPSNNDENIIETLKPEYDNWFRAMSTLYQTVQQKLADGEFKGDKGDTGEKGEKGDKGNNGIVIPANGMYTFEIEDNDLNIIYNDADEPPSVYLDSNGHLIFGEEE